MSSASDVVMGEVDDNGRHDISATFRGRHRAPQEPDFASAYPVDVFLCSHKQDLTALIGLTGVSCTPKPTAIVVQLRMLPR